MKLGTIALDGEERLVAALGEDAAVLLADAYEAAGLGAAPVSMNDLIRGGAAERARLDAALAAAASSTVLRRLDPAALDWLPPQPRPSKIISVAFNSHGLARTLHVAPDVPNFVFKAPSSLVGHGKPIVIEDEYGETIPQLEIAAIIGERVKNVPREKALAAVFGYAITNGVTAHGIRYKVDSLALTRAPGKIEDWHMAFRRRHGPEDRDLYFTYFARSRSADSFGPMGPWIATADAIPDPNRIALSGSIDGELFATDSTADYRFPIDTSIAEASRWFTLEPGDIISFGTAAKAAGKYPDGHREIDFHRFGDELVIEAEGIGRLVTPIKRNF